MARRLLKKDTIDQVKESDLGLSIPADPHVVYHIRTITPDVVRQFLVATTTKPAEGQPLTPAQMQADDERFGDTLLDYAIAGWEQVLDDGVPAACSLQNKRALPSLIQAAIVRRAQTGQVRAEDVAASFRESARVV